MHQVSKALLAALVALETLASGSSSAPPILLSLVPALPDLLRAPGMIKLDENLNMQNFLSSFPMSISKFEYIKTTYSFTCSDQWMQVLVLGHNVENLTGFFLLWSGTWCRSYTSFTVNSNFWKCFGRWFNLNFSNSGAFSYWVLKVAVLSQSESARFAVHKIYWPSQVSWVSRFLSWR